jgi:mannose-6-phosphate isomerase-like protein (cupin superfamily)|tara:strand:+ start:175 stop:522 length:348 start_codon:yes stop_codon:yes gene_type:complete
MIVNKPWGHENIWALTEKYVGKILYIKKGNRLSLQFHQVKEETIMVLEGKMELVLEEGSRREERRIIMNPGDTYHISPLTVHRFCASQDTDVKLIEVSTSEIHDVVRLQDDHGRS